MKPNVYDGSFVVLQVPNQLETEETSGTSGWSILLKLQEHNMLLLHVSSPPTTAVGEWTMGIQLDNDEPGTVNQRIYILYNPWNKGKATHHFKVQHSAGSHAPLLFKMRPGIL